jgi:hypothetical protein
MAEHRDVRARVAASLRATQSPEPAAADEPGQLAFGLPPGAPPAA